MKAKQFRIGNLVSLNGKEMAEWQKENEKRIVSISSLEDCYQQELFNYLHSELDVIALQSQMHDIERIVDSMPSKNIYSEAQIREVQLEVIADEFAIEFIEWCGLRTVQITKSEWANWLPNADGNLSTKELLQIFKKEKGL